MRIEIIKKMMLVFRRNNLVPLLFSRPFCAMTTSSSASSSYSLDAVTKALPSEWTHSDARTMAKQHILSEVDYEKVRKDILPMRRTLLERRRVIIGPDASFLFTNFDTIWFQIHEMLRIEKGGDAQIKDEIEAYQPLIPTQNKLVGAFMIEVNDKERRKRVLTNLVGIEKTLSLSFKGHIIAGFPIEDEIDREKHGKTSAIHFIQFPITEIERRSLLDTKESFFVCIGHNQYNHMTRVSPQLLHSLQQDLK